ncbi:polysialyltransferase family glycosyltransferase [Isoptericola haloaureus]|uniref:Polysialyltransferase family glycosyltransferase n=1 Tax=Isoptericola haloaureus TaxID=1542902 RepID=A0ABU7Z548_9MICO
MTTIVVASTLYGAMTAAAALEDEQAPRSRDTVLVVVNNAAAPELTPALDEIDAAAPVLARFDRVFRLGPLLAPAHPSTWDPSDDDLPVLRRLLQRAWGLDDTPPRLLLESVGTLPSRTLARVFHDAAVVVYSDGLMSYGATRTAVPLEIAQRIEAVRYLDLVPGLAPLLLSEHGVPSHPIDVATFRSVIDEVADRTDPPATSGNGRSAVLVGQYLATLGILSRDEETALHVSMVRAAADRGATRVRFKPHPSALPSDLGPVRAAAREAGVTMEVIDDASPVEAILRHDPPTLVVGCYSTSLVATERLLGVEAVTVGTATVLSRLRPYADSNRIPLTIVDGAHADPSYDADRLRALVASVVYAMHPERLPWLRSTAEEFLETADGDTLDRYFAGASLDALGLPGETPRRLRSALRRSASRVLRSPMTGLLVRLADRSPRQLIEGRLRGRGLRRF